LTSGCGCGRCLQERLLEDSKQAVQRAKAEAEAAQKKASELEAAAIKSKSSAADVGKAIQQQLDQQTKATASLVRNLLGSSLLLVGLVLTSEGGKRGGERDGVLCFVSCTGVYAFQAPACA